MRKIFLAVPMALLIFSCQKDKATSDPLPEVKKFDVTFTTGFSTNVTNMSLDRKTTNGVNQPVAGNIDNLYYRVFNSTGTLVNGIEQSSTVAGFGTITDKLPAGTYSVFIAGSKGSLIMGTGQTVSMLSSYFYPPTDLWNDTFFNQFSLTVGTSSVTQAVSLDRLIGAVDVTLTDAIPSNAKKITLIFSDYMMWSNLTGGVSASNSRSVDFSLTNADVGIKNKVFSVLAGATSTTVPFNSSLTIRSYDSTNGLISEKVVQSVPVYRNKRTAVTGALFPTGTTNQNVGFNVTVNTDWGTPPASITF